MSKGERTWVFWLGLVVVASALTVLFYALWSFIFIYPLLTDPRFIVQIALGTGMQPRHEWAFFQAYSWLSSSGSSYLLSDYYWKFLVPPITGGLTFMLIGLYMMRRGTETEKEEKTRPLMT